MTRAGAAPRVSVVIPSHRRERRLHAALESLAAQTLARERFEVIVVRSPETEARTVAPAGLGVRFLRAPLAGPARQRNLGWRTSAGELIAFTDDDCRPSADWLEAILRCWSGAEEPGRSAVAGTTRPDRSERDRLRGFARTMEVSDPNPWYPSCNIAYPRALLERLGGFDESFTAAWGEDTDLAMRALDAGARLLHEPAAVVEHAVHPRSIRAALAETLARDSLPKVIADHPRLRSELRYGVFLRERHARLALAAAALILARGDRRALAASLPWVLEALDLAALGPRPLARQLIELPGRALLDAAAIATHLRASARAGVLVV